MAASSKLMIIEAERRFPVRIRVGVPLEGLGGRLDQMRAWARRKLWRRWLGSDAHGDARRAE